jgi:hypothetical protein
MWRVLIAVALGVPLCLCQPALAQPPSGRDEVRRLAAEIERLRNRIENLERRLHETASVPGRRDGVRPLPPRGSWGPMNPERMRAMRARLESVLGPEQAKEIMDRIARRAAAARASRRPLPPWAAPGDRGGRAGGGPAMFGGGFLGGRGAGAFAGGPPGGAAAGPPVFGGGGFGPGAGIPPGAGRLADIDRKLERILREIEELRRDARRQ